MAIVSTRVHKRLDDLVAVTMEYRDAKSTTVPACKIRKAIIRRRAWRV